jgi:hypothetical protein
MPGVPSPNRHTEQTQRGKAIITALPHIVMAVSDAHKRASVKYNASKDNIMLRPSKEDGARIRKAAADAGKSVQRYCLDILLDVCPASAEDVQEEQGG